MPVWEPARQSDILGILEHTTDRHLSIPQKSFHALSIGPGYTVRFRDSFGIINMLSDECSVRNVFAMIFRW